MATVTIPNSPVHSDSVLTAVYGETGSHWSSFHTGTDFAPTGDTPSNPPLFSVCDGVVVEISNSTTLWHGNMVLIKDDLTGNYWRYCHMRNASPLSVGDRVNTGTVVRSYGRNSEMLLEFIYT